jgi:hypothetical protein
LDQFGKDIVGWRSIPSDIPASRWTPAQRAINDTVTPVMSAFADESQALGEGSGNLVFQDLAGLSAQYRRAYVQSLPTYVASDNYLSEAAITLSGVVQAACQTTPG